MMDAYDKHDEERIQIAKEDIDNLLVFVRVTRYFSFTVSPADIDYGILRLVYYLLSFLPLSWKRIEDCRMTPLTQQTKFSSKSPLS